MWRVHEIAPSATSTQLVVHALPADAPARRGGNLSNSCTQVPLETVIQLLTEAGVVLASDASASALGKPSEAAVPDADNLDLANMPATFDYLGDETSWQQGRPPGEVWPQSSELELSDSDSSVASILGVCLDGFDGDAWTSDAEGAQDYIQVGQTAGVNDPDDIPWSTTGWRAGAEVVASAKLPTSHGGLEGETTVSGDGASSVQVPLTADEEKEKKRLQDKARKTPSDKSHKKNRPRVEDNADNRARSARQIHSLSKL